MGLLNLWDLIECPSLWQYLHRHHLLIASKNSTILIGLSSKIFHLRQKLVNKDHFWDWEAILVFCVYFPCIVYFFFVSHVAIRSYLSLCTFSLLFDLHQLKLFLVKIIPDCKSDSHYLLSIWMTSRRPICEKRFLLTYWRLNHLEIQTHYHCSSECFLGICSSYAFRMCFQRHVSNLPLLRSQFLFQPGVLSVLETRQWHFLPSFSCQFVRWFQFIGEIFEFQQFWACQ